MAKIIELDDVLSNKIAAGEVVERPASVVKELVENAIDADSSRIEIDVEEGGLASIRIIDNGDGIVKDDCLTAFRRHATSKIKDEQDLFNIRTLGFRGEALPSIASVSRVELKTSTGEAAGTSVIIESGKVLETKAANSRKGTDMLVTKLFYNTPARLKHMKTVHTELGNITECINRLALAHPEISFRLTHNGKDVLHTNGSNDLRQVIASIYGMSVAKKMLRVSAQSIDFNVQGYVAKPELTRASRNYISVYINGRYIKNYPIFKAIQNAYHTLLPIGRFPIGIISIEMDPSLVDVNVHPSKLEARLSKESELTELIQSAVTDSLKQSELMPEYAPSKTKQKNSEQASFHFEHKNKSENRDHNIKQNLVVKDPSPITTLEQKRAGPPIDDEPVDTVMDVEEPPTSAKGESRIPPLYPIGQMHGTYILAQNELGLYLIDQHAAQERIKYEYFREKVSQPTLEVQELLMPLTFEFTASEMAFINEHIEELRKVGVFLEPFGRDSYIIRAHPQWFPNGEEQEIIESIVEQVVRDKKASVQKLREEAAIMMSCKGSIKANHHLRNDEMFELLETLRKAEDPFTCPHGRPIIIHFSSYELEKMFKRVM
jgi:DNA mismatch repair protein MutL